MLKKKRKKKKATTIIIIGVSSAVISETASHISDLCSGTPPALCIGISVLYQKETLCLVSL